MLIFKYAFIQVNVPVKEGLTEMVVESFSSEIRLFMRRAANTAILSPSRRVKPLGEGLKKTMRSASPSMLAQLHQKSAL